ncbi:MAG: heavy-metal-associated domain-containing protein, partial [Syntrophobacterales bacterium]|nr:heavy-metal-associated domain-containing protein [Syntrophobacterales bacterium]
TNAMTILTVFKVLGKKSTIVYLSAIALISLLLGYLLNIFTAHFGFQNVIILHNYEILPAWLKAGGSVMLAMMIGWYYLKIKIFDRVKGERDVGDNKISLSVQGMTCMHCASTVKKAVESVAGTSDVNVHLDEKSVTFETEEEAGIKKVKQAIERAGYGV